MRPRRKIFLGLVIAFIAINLLGLWHFVTYSYVWVNVNDYALAEPGRRLYGQPHNVQLDLMDKSGNVVAVARSVSKGSYEYLAVVHPDPEIGDCSQYGRGEEYMRCSKRLSRWVNGWVLDVRKGNLTKGECIIRDVPIASSFNISDLWLWLLPQREIWRLPSKYVNITLFVDTRECRIAPPTR